MKPQIGYASQRLAMRTGLRAGELCNLWDTNCIMVDGEGQSVGQFNTCDKGVPGAGTGCMALLATLRDNPVGLKPPAMVKKWRAASCQRC
jgi:hypothetical protein